AGWSAHRRRAVLHTRRDKIGVALPDDPRLAADHQLELPFQPHPHLLVHVLVRRHRRHSLLEVEEGEHDPLAPYGPDEDPRQHLLRWPLSDVEEWHRLRPSPGHVPAVEAP